MNIGIIGCGNMGTGLAELLSPFHRMLLHDRDGNWTQELASQVKGEAYHSIPELIEKAQLIFLAVKPQNLKEIAPVIHPHLKKDHILISLMAGTPLSILKQEFPLSTVVRIMPNLSMQYGAGVVGIVDSPDLSLSLKDDLEKLLAPLGLLYWLKESQIDALTSLTGSGPAFFLSLIEAMTEAGVAMGFQAAEAEELILQMLQGSLILLKKTGKHPAELKRQISSPNGTTIAGLRVFEKESVKSGLIDTFLAAYQRAQEISKGHAHKEN